MKSRIDLIVEVASYGLQHVEHDGDVNEPYDVGAIDTVGHMVACCICQWFMPEESVGTGETVDALELFKFPNKQKLKKLLIKYIAELKK